MATYGNFKYCFQQNKIPFPRQYFTEMKRPRLIKRFIKRICSKVTFVEQEYQDLKYQLQKEFELFKRADQRDSFGLSKQTAFIDPLRSVSNFYKPS